MGVIISAVTGWFTSSSWAIYAAIGAVIVAIVGLLLFRLTSQAEALGETVVRLDVLKENARAIKARDVAGALPSDPASTVKRLRDGSF